MKRIVVLQVLFVQFVLAGVIAYPAFADDAPMVVVQPAPVVVQPQPVVVQPQPVVVQPQVVAVQPQAVAVQPQAVVVKPYSVIEGSATILVDPEDYYYQDGEAYYHHDYQADKDVVVKVVPSGYKFVHSKIDITKVPREHFHHVEKTETVKTQVNPVSGAATVQKETTTTVKK